MTCHNTVHCYGSETCLDTDCPNHPEQPSNKWGAGHPLPLHRQVMPPEPKEQDGYQSGLWMVYTAAALILLAFCFMTWLAYPNLPQ